MSDTALNRYVAQGDDAAEAGYTPDPVTGVTPEQAVLFVNDEDPTTPLLKWWDGLTFVEVGGGGGSGTVTNTGTLTDHALIVGNGTVDVSALGSLGTTSTVLHGNAAGDPSFGQVALGSEVSGDLPFANLTQIAGLSVLGVTGSATADVAAITAGVDGYVLTRVSSSSLAFAAPSGSGAMTQIQQIITTSSQATADFTSISGAYSTLKLIWEAQATAAGTAGSAMSVKINNDATAGNYTSCFRLGSQNAGAFSNSIASSTSGAEVGYIPNVGNTSISGSGEVTFASYARTVFHKRLYAVSNEDDGSTNGTTYISQSRWKSTAAITRLTVSTAGTAFTDGSVFTLYGLS